MSHGAVTIRPITPTDTDGLTHLVTFGSRAYVPGSTGLVAEIDGAAVAAISLTSGAVAADRDRADSRAVKSLRYRRSRILRQGGAVGRGAERAPTSRPGKPRATGMRGIGRPPNRAPGRVAQLVLPLALCWPPDRRAVAASNRGRSCDCRIDGCSRLGCPGGEGET